MIRKGAVRRRRNVHTRARRHIVKYHGSGARIRDLREHFDKPALRSLVVVRRHHQNGVRTRLAGASRQIKRVRRIVGARTRNNRTRPAARFTANAIASRCSSSDSVDASPVVPHTTSPLMPGGNLIVDQPAEILIIDPAFAKRG